MKKILLSLATAAVALCASASDTWQLGPYSYQADTLFHVTAGPGITTTGVRLSTSSNKTNIFYSTIDLTNPDLEIRGVQAKDNGDVTESVNAMGVRKNKQGDGHYITGVNSDFFNMGGSPTRTLGHSLVDGILYNTGIGEDSWQNWATYAVVDGAKDIRLQNGVQATRFVTFANGTSYTYHINGARYENYLVLYTKAGNTGTNQYGSECALKIVSGSVLNNDATFEVVSEPSTEGNMKVETGGFVLSGNGAAAALVSNLKPGDRLSIDYNVRLNGKEISPRQMVGGCSYIVMNGRIADAAYFSPTIVDHFNSNQARTVIGYNEDRSKLIILVADKYSSYKTAVTDTEKRSYGTSTGFVLERMGHIMLHLGCYTAMNFDGGGSSQLYNKEVGICNVPYGDTYLRPVANGIFAVSTTPDDKEIAYIEVRQKNVNVASNSTFTPTVYGYNKYGVLVNANVGDYTFTVAPELGSVATSGHKSTFTAGSAKGTTIGVVSLNSNNADGEPIRCGVRILANGGGNYVTSGDDTAPIMVKKTYESEKPLGIDKEPIFLSEQWHFVNENLNDGWDGTAPDWTSTDAIKAKSCPRFATARNGRFYTVDMCTMSIAEIDPEGNLTPLYKLPSLEGREINGVPDYYGCAISSDDAGNFIIGHLFTKTDTYRVWTIYDPKTGKSKHFEIEVPAGETSSGRIDNIGRVVGNLTTNAYVYVAPKATADLNSQKALIINFKGDGDVDNVTATPAMSAGLYLAGTSNSLSIIQPKYATVAEMSGKDLNNTYYWYSKTAGVGQYNQDLFTYDGGVISTNYASDLDNYSALNAFDTFILGGTRYFVVGYAAKGELQYNQHIIVIDEQLNRVAEWNNPDYTSAAGYLTITAVPVNANQVNIYLYSCTGNYAEKGSGNGAISGALLSLTLGKEYEPYEPKDITPSGYRFDNYSDGDAFKITATGVNGGWSGPANLYHGSHHDAFDNDGHLTSVLMRGLSSEFNSQEWIDKNIQPVFAVRQLDEYIGKALVINEAWSPTASKFGWPYQNFAGLSPQLSFYMRNEDITDNKAEKHYVRVRLVYNVLMRGCHYAMDVAANKDLNVVKGIYATNESNYVVPDRDNLTGALYAETGIDFAKWVNETGKAEDIPANPEVYTPADSDVDEWDAAHHENGCAADPNVKPTYLMNSERFRVYEFDTYLNDPELRTLSVQLNFHNRNCSYIIKEIKFTDLGTDESAAYLLGRRAVSWKYYNANSASGIESIATDQAQPADDTSAVYYNLQGVQVSHPAHGIYIVRRGSSVSKEYIY